jgi:cytochrome P450
MWLESISKMDYVTSAAVGVATLATVYIIYKLQSKSRAPPSLHSLPFIGSLPFLPWKSEDYHEFFLNKSKQLGPVFSFQAGSQYVLVLNGGEAIHEALVKRSTDFGDRAPMFAERVVWNSGLRGIISKRYDGNFKKYHLLSLTILKEFGFGNPRVLESRITTELQEFLKLIKATNGQPMYPKELVSFSLLNIISEILLSHRFEAVDSTIRDFIQQASQFINQLDPVLDIIPSARHLTKYRTLVEEMRCIKSKLMATVKALVQVGLGKENEKNFVRSFVEKEGENYDAEELEYLVRDLANGGMQTTSIMIQWALILLGNNPADQDKMRKEIDSVVPRDRLLSLDDRRQLPYVEAALLEVFRCRGLLPFVFPHETASQTEVCGYQIPEKATVLVNMHSLRMDAELWPDPQAFKPERFLNEDGAVVNKEKVVSFSLGKRSCPGEGLARHEVFLFVTSLVQQFNILPPEGQDKIRDEAVVIRFLQPEPFEVRFVARN